MSPEEFQRILDGYKRINRGYDILTPFVAGAVILYAVAQVVLIWCKIHGH